MTALMRLRDRFRSLGDEIGGMDPMDLAPRLTLALLTLHAGQYWYIQVPMTVVCIAGFLLCSLYRSATYWVLLTGVMIWGNTVDWYEIDNHKYLMTYWCLAICCVLRHPDPAGSLALNARLLIGLCFTFATLWKLLAPDYLSGSFFQATLLTDRRFRSVAEFVGGVPSSMLDWNQLMVGQLGRGAGIFDEVPLQSSPRLPALANGLTAWTFTIELLLAAAFLAPLRSRLSAWRNPLLLVFGVTTYAVANVVGYGWLLMAMGASQCGPRERRSRILFVLTFFMIQVYTAPWRRIFGG